jgi:uncharacterized membrane protein YhaH (DUF805 family)
MEEYLNVWRQYAVFNGRASRPEFWLWYLLNIVAALLLAFIGGAIGLHGYLSGIYNIAAFIPGLAVSVRRLHDTGRSGWNLLWWILPVIGWIVLIVFYAERSTADNQYGPKPPRAL